MKRCVWILTALFMLLSACHASPTDKDQPEVERLSLISDRLARHTWTMLIRSSEPERYTLVLPKALDADAVQTDGYRYYTYRYRDQGTGLTLTADFLQTSGPEPCEGLNALLRRTAVEDAFAFDTQYDARSWPNTDYDVECELTYSGRRCLSMCFYSFSCAYGAAHPNWERWGATVDLETGEPLRLGQIVDVGESFPDWVRAQKWTPLNHWLPDNSSDEEYAARLVEERLPFLPEDTLRDFYLTDDALVLIVWEGRYDTRLSVPLDDLTLKRDL